MYVIEIRNADDETLGQFESFSYLKFGKRLNDYGTCEFKVPISDNKLSSLIALRKNTVWIYRDGELEWSGEMALRKTELDSKGGGFVTIHSFTWLEQLKARFTSALLQFDQIDQGEIMSELINGAFGITDGTIEETIPRDRKYYNQNVYEALINLSNVISGLDFEITDLKVFNASTVIGVDRSDSVVIEYGHNIIDCTIVEDFTQPVNRAIILGEATGETSLSRVEVDDVPLQTEYQLREGVISEMNVSDSDTMEDKGYSLLRKQSYPVLKIDQNMLPNSPNISQFAIGDVIRVLIQNQATVIDTDYRVFEYEVEYDSNNREKLSLILGSFTI